MSNFKKNIFRTEDSGVISYSYYLSSLTNASSVGVCGYSYDLVLYSNSSSLIIGSVFYTDSELTILFNGLSLYQHINISSIYGKSISINASGVVIDIDNPCYPSYFVINTSNSTPISNCDGAGVSTYPISLYVEDIPVILGTIFYNNYLLTLPFTGDGTWYSVSSTLSYRIDASGMVTEIDNSCAIPE